MVQKLEQTFYKKFTQWNRSIKSINFRIAQKRTKFHFNFWFVEFDGLISLIWTKELIGWTMLVTN